VGCGREWRWKWCPVVGALVQEGLVRRVLDSGRGDRVGQWTVVHQGLGLVLS